MAIVLSPPNTTILRAAKLALHTLALRKYAHFSRTQIGGEIRKIRVRRLISLVIATFYPYFIGALDEEMGLLDVAMNAPSEKEMNAYGIQERFGKTLAL